MTSIPESDGTPALASDDARLSRSTRLGVLRRQIIMDAALRVFARDGLDRTTIRAIAAEAGCTTGAIYPWFAGKEHIYGALLEQSLQRLRNALVHTLARFRDDEAARQTMETLYNYYAEDGTAFSMGLYLYQGVGPRGLSREFDARLSASLNACVNLLGAGLARTVAIAPEQLRIEQMNVFTYLMGLLLLRHTGRLKSMGHDARPLLDSYCADLETRNT